VSDDLLNGLDPSGREAAKQLVAIARYYGLPVVVTSGYRTATQQAKLTPGAGLPKAKNPLLSRHVQRRAFDLGFQGYRWYEIPMDYWQWLGAIWRNAGGRWGGDFSVSDPVHFDW